MTKICKPGLQSDEIESLNLITLHYSLIKHGHENAPLHMTAVVDPLTKAGQRLAAILKVSWYQIVR